MISWVHVGMVLARQPAIGLLDLVGRRGLPDAKRAVVILEFHRPVSLQGPQRASRAGCSQPQEASQPIQLPAEAPAAILTRERFVAHERPDALDHFSDRQQLLDAGQVDAKVID